MRRRFFVEQVRNGHAEIEGEEAKHLTRVLRVEVGQKYEISDDRALYLAEIETARKEHVVFRTLERLPDEPGTVHLALYASLIKFDHFEWMIEKATELGVTEIIPVETVRSERGLERAAVKRMDRWRRIALEASQQSRRMHLPSLAEPQELQQALAASANYRYFLDEQPGGTSLHGAIPPARSLADRVAVLIGPEGGWTDLERTVIQQAGWQGVTMGRLILRAETAALAALAVLTNAWLLH